MSDEVWILGGTGRTARAIASDLGARGVEIVLVGRDPARLGAAAEPTGARTVTTANLDEMTAAIRRERPAVVINTLGAFLLTGAAIIEGSPDGTSYVDLANDVAAVPEVLRRDATAKATGRTFVTGAGFGVTATESIVTKLLEGRSTAERVRIDMIPSVEIAEGLLGEALAETLVGGLPGVAGGGRFQGRRIVNGRLTTAALGGAPHRLTTPDGDRVTTSLMPLGELVAAQRASGAAFVDAASSELPANPIVRAILPAALSLLHIAPLRRYAARRLAAVHAEARPKPREHSWGHARIQWADGTVREGWLRLPEAGDFTARVAAEVAYRIATQRALPGAYTPAALFGSELAESCGGMYLLTEQAQR